MAPIDAFHEVGEFKQTRNREREGWENNGGVFMHCPFFLTALLSLGLFVGAAGAGEDDIMAMRGDAGDGKTRVNAFQANWRHAAQMRLASDGAAPLTAAIQKESFLAWKNSCVLVPPVVAGKPVDLRQPGGYDQVAPYIRKPDTEGGGYLELLAEELNAEE